MSMLLLGVGNVAGVTPIDPHTLPNRIFEIRSHDVATLITSLPSTLVSADGDTLEAWVDEGDDGTRSPLQLTASVKPKYKTNITPNGKSAILFETDDRMTLAAPIDNAEFVDCTVYFVGIPAGGSNQTVVSSATTSDAFQLRFSSTNRNQVLRNTVANLGTATDAVSTTVPSVSTITYNGSTLNYEKNGVANGSISVSASFANDTTGLGHSITLELYQGYMMHLVIFTEIHDAATRAGVAAYLKSFWGVP